MISVPGHRVLVKPRDIKKTTESGISIEYGQNEDLERAATNIGVVEQVGPDAWKTMYISGYVGAPWAKVGDEVYFAKYAGKSITDESTGERFMVLNDEDITAVIVKGDK